MVRKSLICAICALCISPASAFGRSLITRDEFVQVRGGPASYCSFPVTTSFRAEHELSRRFANVPDDFDPDAPGSGAYQVSGKHFVKSTETVTNPATGVSIDLHGVSLLNRRDVDISGLTIDSDGRRTGEVRTTDHYSGSLTGTAPREGAVVFRTGHSRVYHTSFFVDDVRIGRLDIPFFDSGPSGPFAPQLCSYLAST